MPKPDYAATLSPEDTIAKAKDILDEIKNSKTAMGILLAYDPAVKSFQFLVMQADHEDVASLLINGIRAVQDMAQDTSDDRVIN